MKESKSQATQNPEDRLDFKKIMPIFLVVLPGRDAQDTERFCRR